MTKTLTIAALTTIIALSAAAPASAGTRIGCNKPAGVTWNC